jgi:uncharacterized peroxidase-related enzyme
VSRLPLVDPADAAGPSHALLARTQQQLGRVPNLYRAMANAPAALDGYLSMRAALVRGTLPERLRERLALLTAEDNACGYCVAAHTFRGAKLGLSSEELAAIRRAEAGDAKTAAALRFAHELIEKRGQIAAAAFEAVRAAGWSNEELSEIVAHVALNIYSNYFNHVAQPALDFPEVP